MEREIFVFFVITFELIKVKSPSAPQSDCLDFSFVKDFHVFGEKMARMGRKTVIYQSQIARHTDSRLTNACLEKL